MSERLPLDSFLRIDMTCGRLEQLYPLGLRPPEKQASSKLRESCRMLHAILDRHELSLNDYMDWFDEQGFEEALTFPDILNSKRIGNLDSERALSKTVRRRIEAAR